MKNLVLMAALSVCMMSCISTAPKSNSENINLVKNYVRSVEELDFEAMGKYLAEDYLGMGPSYGDSITKSEAIENWKYVVANIYEKIEYTRSRYAVVSIPDGDNAGDWVANWAELNIVFKNGGGSVTIWANTNYLIENGKIARSLTFYNEADALRQLGYMFVLP